jgi:YegS/Rv2252/BmrU family lipid kinase
MKRKIRFIINPKSGVQKKYDFPALIEKHIDKTQFDFDIAHTEYKKHAKTLAEDAAKESFDIVCIVGGDGSVHEVGTALIGTKTTLAIIPAGSGNGLARHLNIPMDYVEAIQTINNGKQEKMDTVLVNDKVFLNVGGYGFDAAIAKGFENHVRRGFWGYVKLVSQQCFGYKSTLFSIEINGECREEKLFLCTIANANEYGNGFCISPNSSVKDGVIELCMMKPFNLLLSPFVIYRFFKKTNDKSRYMEIIPFQKARITLHSPIAHYDGEPFDIRKELNIEVLPNSLRILINKNSHVK